MSKSDLELKGAERVRVMLESLKSDSIIVRTSGAENLADAAMNEADVAIPMLVSALDATNDWWTVRFGALEALSEMAKRSGKGLAEKWVSKIQLFLTDEDVDFVARVAECLGHQRNQVSLDPLVRILGHEYETIREFTALALGRLGSEKAVPSLIKCLSDSNSSVRAAAATAIGIIGSGKPKLTIGELTELLRQPSEGVYRAAAVALGNIGNPKCILPLIASLYYSFTTPEGREDILTSIRRFSVDSLAKEIKESSTDIHEYIDHIEDLTHYIEYAELTKMAEKEKQQLIDQFNRTLRRMQNEIDSINAFVADTFRTLSTINEDKILDTILSSIPAKHALLSKVDFPKLKRTKWVQKALFQELRMAESLFRDGNGGLQELKGAVEQRKKSLK